MNLGNRVAEEAQLLAEEKWIIEALEKVKTQRNCLQIERLQLESMKKQLEVVKDKSVDVVSKSTNIPTANVPEAEAQNSIQKLPLATGFSKTLLFETEESLCNNEELNLKVTNSVFSQLEIEDLNAEEDEDEYDEEDGEDLLLDMNMFMHASENKKNTES